MLEESGAMNIVLTKKTNNKTKTVETYACFKESQLDEMIDKMKEKIKAKYYTDNGETIVKNETYTLSIFTF